jgi:hypothetical protein
VHPSILKNVVKNSNTAEKINNIKAFGSYMTTLTRLKQRGLDMFQKYYVDPQSLSDEYKKW